MVEVVNFSRSSLSLTSLSYMNLELMKEYDKFRALLSRKNDPKARKLNKNLVRGGPVCCLDGDLIATLGLGGGFSSGFLV